MSCERCGNEPHRYDNLCKGLCANCYRKDLRRQGRLKPDRRVGRRAEQKRKWDRDHGH